ncbi:unnamed protein product [Enterobius vermicularis]|uniref:Uncharacterized protein n=1 Tax=Enterobius vermicularis TaxID=51028 RepID=A0A3P6IMH7_ENTVE|nr:unnamed protein product [Enterobius vermicularis]
MLPILVSLLLKETVIPVECLLREPAPVPEADTKLSDWVSSVKTTEKYTVNVFYLGSMVLSGGHGQIIILSELEDGKEQSFVPQAVFRGHERSIECLAVSPDGSRFVSGSFDTFLKVWNPDLSDDETNYKGKENGTVKKRKTAITKTPIVTLTAHVDAVVAVSWLPNSKNDVVTASWDHSMVFWDLELGVGFMPSSKSFTCLAVCPSSNFIITGSADPIVRLWDPRKGSLVKQTFMGHTGWVSSVSWKPNSDHVFISSSFDQVTKMWDVRSGKTSLYDLKGHDDRILCSDWSRKELIVSGGADCTMKVFKTES